MKDVFFTTLVPLERNSITTTVVSLAHLVSTDNGYAGSSATSKVTGLPTNNSPTTFAGNVVTTVTGLVASAILPANYASLYAAALTPKHVVVDLMAVNFTASVDDGKAGRTGHPSVSVGTRKADQSIAHALVTLARRTAEVLANDGEASRRHVAEGLPNDGMAVAGNGRRRL